ncbi:AAA family ATPase [Nocardia sp. CA-128927]|uniref:AAA family ATPase n=1 Tax=Nocardia sp. CA-128927 TaxID=3239975 RepID=UPI003D993250
METASADDSSRLSDDFVHLTRLAMAGREQDVAMFVRRVARRNRQAMPDMAEALIGVLRQSPTRASPLRGEISSPVPVDGDSRLPLLSIIHEGTDVEQPILAEEVFRPLQQIVDERGASERLAAADLSPARTVLFVGPPGVGKTMAATWIAARLSLPLVILDLATVMSSLLGKTGTNLRHAIDYAKQRPCVLLLDELDAIAKRRDDDRDVGELKRLVTVLLQQIDDWPAGAGLVIGATNHAELLDPAVWRRFDVSVGFPLPGPDQRRDAIRRFAAQPLPGSVVELATTASKGKSYNDIERVTMQLRRRSVLDNAPLEDLMLKHWGQVVQDLPRAERLQVATTLAEAGTLSQRQISLMTGVSRDTIRGFAQERSTTSH